MELIEHKSKWYIKSNTGYSEVLATTDKSLKIETEEFFNTSSHGKVAYKKIIPQITQQFIEDYCKAGGIDEIYVQYEDFCKKAHPFNYCPDCKCFKSESCDYGKEIVLTLNNCVITVPIKESWNLEEINTLMEKAYVKGYSDKNDGKDHTNEKLADWIKENLK